MDLHFRMKASTFIYLLAFIIFGNARFSTARKPRHSAEAVYQQWKFQNSTKPVVYLKEKTDQKTGIEKVWQGLFELIYNSTRLYIKCKAPYPVRWFFSGAAKDYANGLLKDNQGLQNPIKSSETLQGTPYLYESTLSGLRVPFESGYGYMLFYSVYDAEEVSAVVFTKALTHPEVPSHDDVKTIELDGEGRSPYSQLRHDPRLKKSHGAYEKRSLLQLPCFGGNQSIPPGLQYNRSGEFEPVHLEDLKRFKWIPDFGFLLQISSELYSTWGLTTYRCDMGDYEMTVAPLDLGFPVLKVDYSFQTKKTWPFECAMIEEPGKSYDTVYGRGVNVYQSFQNCETATLCENDDSKEFSSKRWCHAGNDNCKHDPENIYLKNKAYGRVRCFLMIVPSLVYLYDDSPAKLFFYGLDKQLYVLPTAIPPNAVIRISGGNPAFFSNEKQEFTCKTVNYILKSIVRFAARLRNGSYELLLHGFPITQTHPEYKWNTNGITRDYASSTTIQLNLQSKYNAITCFSPDQNTSEWWNATFEFNAIDASKPKVHSFGGMQEFVQGETQQVLRCDVTGHPRPTIRWTVPPSITEDNYLIHGAGKEYLEFLRVDASVQGDYSCNASNKWGSDAANFTVKMRPDESSQKTLVISSTVGSLLLFLIILLAFSTVKYLRAKKRLRNLTAEEVNEFLYGILLGSSEHDAKAKDNRKDSRPFQKRIDKDDLTVELHSLVGHGEFGLVYRGNYLGGVVAVKIAKPSVDIAKFKTILDEVKIMEYLGGHPNIVEFIGAEVTEIETRKIWVVLEFSPIGSLFDYFRKHGGEGSNGDLNSVGFNTAARTADEFAQKMISWCEQIACAMHFLTQLKVVHGDLAARNVLLFDDDKVKITDFGLAKILKDLPVYIKKKREKMPWRWMSFESLKFMEFSQKSDVWSYGVTAWEIFTLGQLPYSHVINWDSGFIQNLCDGMRLSKPELASYEIYEKLSQCWSIKKDERPSFESLQGFFRDMMVMDDQTTPTVYVDCEYLGT